MPHPAGAALAKAPFHEPPLHRMPPDLPLLPPVAAHVYAPCTAELRISPTCERPLLSHALRRASHLACQHMPCIQRQIGRYWTPVLPRATRPPMWLVGLHMSAFLLLIRVTSISSIDVQVVDWIQDFERLLNLGSHLLKEVLSYCSSPEREGARVGL